MDAGNEVLAQFVGCGGYGLGVDCGYEGCESIDGIGLDEIP